MKERSRTLKTILVGALMLAVGGLAGPAVAANLTYGSPLPSTHVLNQGAIEPFLELLERESDGAMNWRFYPGGTTAKLPAVMESIRNGIVDSGYMIDSLTFAEQSYNVLAGRVSTYGNDAMVMAGAANEYLLLHCEQCVDQLNSQNIVPLAYVATTPFKLVCRDEYRDASEMDGLRFRAPGSYGQIAAKWGGVPVNIPPTDMFEALQRGMADCTFGPEAHIRNYSLYEVARYVIDQSFGMYMSGSVFNMNQRTWRSLADSEREVIMNNLGRLVAMGVEGYVEEADDARRSALERGMTYIEPGPGIVAAVEEYKASLFESVEAAARARGIDDIRPILEQFPAIMAKWEQIVEDIDHDYDLFAEALQREVFSRYQP